MSSPFPGFVLGCASMLLVGCVSIDPRVSTEVVDREKTRAMSGEFSNWASYRTRGEFIAIGNLAEIFQVPSSNADRVRVARDPFGGLTLTWFQGPRQWETLTFPRESLKVADDGSIELPTERSSSMKEGAYGQTWSTVRLFINASGDLATIQTRGGVGGIGIVPVGIHANHLAIFPRRP